jgi:hypothetical protein
MEDQPDLRHLDTNWASDRGHLSHLHTMWAPYLELACIALKKPIPPAIKTAKRSTLFKQISYDEALPILAEAVQNPSYVLDYMSLFQPGIMGWVGEFVGQQRTVKDSLEVLSFLSPVLDTQCINYMIDFDDRFDVRLSHLLIPLEQMAVSGAIQVATVLVAVHKHYWTNGKPRPIEVYVPEDSEHTMSRAALNIFKDKLRWPVVVNRHRFKYYQVIVPKLDVDGYPLETVAPFRGGVLAKADAELREGLFNNRVLLDLCIQRYMLCNLNTMSLDRFCEWLKTPRATLTRLLKKHELSWTELKTECRYRYHYAMLAHGHTEKDVAESLGCSVSEQRRWIRNHTETFKQSKIKRREQI